MATINLSQDELAERFRFIDEIREMGIINMFGASQYLEEMYPDGTSKIIHSAWMRTFDGKSSADDRAREALRKEIK